MNGANETLNTTGIKCVSIAQKKRSQRYSLKKTKKMDNPNEHYDLDDLGIIESYEDYYDRVNNN